MATGQLKVSPVLAVNPECSAVVRWHALRISHFPPRTETQKPMPRVQITYARVPGRTVARPLVANGLVPEPPR